MKSSCWSSVIRTSQMQRLKCVKSKKYFRWRYCSMLCWNNDKLSLSNWDTGLEIAKKKMIFFISKFFMVFLVLYVISCGWRLDFIIIHDIPTRAQKIIIFCNAKNVLFFSFHFAHYNLLHFAWNQIIRSYCMLYNWKWIVYIRAKNANATKSLAVAHLGLQKVKKNENLLIC